MKNVKADVSYYDCVYCGVRAASRDHIIPFCHNNYSDRQRNQHDYSMEDVVPTCRECNTTLAHLWLPSIAERASHLKFHYESKYKKLLNAPDWTEEELEEITGNLKRHVVSLQRKKKFTHARISVLSSVMEMKDLTPIEVWKVLDPKGVNKHTIHGLGI